MSSPAGHGPPPRAAVPGIIDTHTHFWDSGAFDRDGGLPGSTTYRLAPNVIADLLFAARASRADRDVIVTPRHVVRPYLPPDHRADAEGLLDAVGATVDGVVHVASSWTGHSPLHAATESAWIDSLNELPGTPIAGLVGFADPRDEVFAALLDAHIAAVVHGRFSGIRIVAGRHPDPEVRDWCDEDSLYQSPAFLRGFRHLAERGLIFEACVYADQTPDVVALAREFPEVTIVVDHLACPVGIFGPVGRHTGRSAAARASIRARWRDQVAALADCPNVVMKISGLGFALLGYGDQADGNIADQSVLTDMVGPLIARCVEVFGPDRIVFGSNFPIDKANASMVMLVGSVLDVTGSLGADLVRNILRDNAIRVYGINT
ncbi:amidohydrolase [Williamsia sp. CHRR-6]|uniref:amidohydrolase family protein n=1 Tax=Williamsia sp. CHRR-6 TaxID=2835871 RepID=UPI001BDA5B7E|nr:amidohydrolase family protein [Williamsia sp. CHRR-6]MBT0566237.1 amidohydrolase family protein [Williamsia sp. CHRR-6]